MPAPDGATLAPKVSAHAIGSGLARVLSGGSRISKKRTHDRRYSDEVVDDGDPITDDWSLMPELKEVQKQREKDGATGRQLGVTWTNLTVKGISADAALNENVGSQFNVPKLVKESRRPAPLK